MKNTVLGLAAVTGATAMLPSQVMAVLPEVDRFTLNLADAAVADEGAAALGIPNFVVPGTVTGQLNINGESFVGFVDETVSGTGLGAISAGDTFWTYGVFVVDGVDGVSLSAPPPFGSPGYGSDHQLTGYFKFHGTQLATPGPSTPGQFQIDAIDDVVIVFDADNTAGTGFTPANPLTTNDLSFFSDGVTVEQAVDLKPSSGEVSLSTTGNAIEAFTVDLSFTIEDVLSMLGAFDPFEIDLLQADGDPAPGSPIPNLSQFMLSLLITTENTFLSNVGGLPSAFDAAPFFDIASVGTPAGGGIFTGGSTDGGQGFDFGFFSFTGGDVNKFLMSPVPEPVTATMGVMGLGALGLVTRRRHVR